MEIRNQCINHFKPVPGINKNIRPAARSLYGSVFTRGTLERPAACRADCDDAASVCPRLINEAGGLFTDLVKFGMHMVFFHRFDLYRPEGAKTDMQGNLRYADAFISDLFQEFFCKMQTGGRGSCASVIACIDCLIAFCVLQFLFDIGRQRHLAELIEDFFKDTVKGETDNSVSLLDNIDHFTGKKPVPKDDLCTGLSLFPGLYQSFPAVFCILDTFK